MAFDSRINKRASGAIPANADLPSEEKVPDEMQRKKIHKAVSPAFESMELVHKSNLGRRTHAGLETHNPSQRIEPQIGRPKKRTEYISKPLETRLLAKESGAFRALLSSPVSESEDEELARLLSCSSIVPKEDDRCTSPTPDSEVASSGRNTPAEPSASRTSGATHSGLESIPEEAELVQLSQVQSRASTSRGTKESFFIPITSPFSPCRPPSDMDS